MRNKPYIVLLIGLTIILPVWGQIPATTTNPQNDGVSFDPDAVKILNETFKVYRNCRSYQDKVRLTVTMKDEKNPDTADGKTRSFDSQLLFERPAKMFFVWPSVTLTCDGKRCQVYYPDLQQYTNQESPAQLNHDYLESLLMENFMTFVINGLTSETPFEDSMRGKDKLEYKQTLENKGVTYHRVQFIDGSDQVELLIDTKDKLIRAMTIKPADPKKHRWELNLDYTSVELNKPIADEKFVIRTPTEAKKVDRISFTRQFDYPKEGQRMPDIALSVWNGGDQKKTVNELLGTKMTFVTFWASWCMPCRNELPILESLYGQYKDKGLAMVCVNLDSSDKKDAIKSFLDQAKLSFPILLDPRALYAKELLVQSLPTLLVLDAKGKIVECHVGNSPDVQKELRTIIEDTIGKSAGQATSHTNELKKSY